MTEDDSDFGLDDDKGVDDARARRGGARTRVVAAVVTIALAALAVGGVAAVRALDLIPLPAPPVLTPAADLLDPGGVGDVRLGMSRKDVMNERADDAFDPNGNVGGHGCWWFQVEGGTDRYDAWAWERDGEVVAVGVGIVIPFSPPDDGLPDGVPRTWPGLAFGAPLEPLPAELDRWVEDDDAPVPILRREHGGVTTTLADTTGDGRLDYATVATATGDPCVRDFDEFRFQASGDVAASSTVSGDRLDGLELGMSGDDARAVPGWQVLDYGLVDGWEQGSADGCTQMWRNGGGMAFLDDETVVGIDALAVADGPSAGMTLDRAQRVLDPATRQTFFGWDQDVSADTWGLWGEVSGTDSSGRTLTLRVMRDHARIDGIDVPVTVPDLAGPPRVTSVLVGRTC